MSDSRVRAPIVLVHGLLGCDRLRLLGWPIADYFNHIPPALEAAGNRVLVPALTPTAAVADRAVELKAFLDARSPREPVHLFAYSMGGLDARSMISHLGMADRVLTLTTLGTSHRGTAFADWLTERPIPAVQPFFDLFGVPTGGFYDLRRDRCAEFNARTPDAPGVHYFSVVSSFKADWMTPEWLLPYGIILEQEGENDGLTSVASATYAEVVARWEGNHLDIVNWPNPTARLRGLWHDRVPDYLALVARLADEGF